MNTDLLVVGGGPAGLAAAIAARMAGLEVTLIERRIPPVDKACGEGIMPGGVRILDDLGVILPPEGTFPFAGIRYVENKIVATGFFPRGPGLGVRRTVLHDAMVRRAAELGVTLLWGRSVEEIRPEGARLADGVVTARWIVAADGHGSKARRTLGLDLAPRRRRVGVRRHYAAAPWSEFVEVHWITGCEIYVTPVGSHQICVAALSDDPSVHLDQALSRFPAILRRLEGVHASSRDLGSETVFRKARSVVRGNVALVGDAAGSVDAVTGAGVTLGLHQAAAVAHALTRGDLRLYAAAYRTIMRLPNAMTAMMLAIKERPAARRWALRSLAGVPPLFSGILALHARDFEGFPIVAGPRVTLETGA